MTDKPKETYWYAFKDKDGEPAKLRPIGKRVAVISQDFKDTEETTASGIIVAKKEGQTGTITAKVVALGEVESKEIKQGSRILISQFGYDEVQCAGDTVLIVPESQILAIL